MQVDAPRAIADLSPLAPFDRYLRASNAVLRCAAMRALVSVQDVAPDDVRVACLNALQDSDPDMRSDAMELLKTAARPEDTPTILYSLELDPVREVKLAAIDTLACLNGPDAVDILRALALSRCDDRVAWEDADSDWEDWLDIQIAAIRALGQMGVTGAIDDLLTARDDEFGQSVDIAVFTALGDMGPDGVTTLLRILDAETGPAQRRAAAALAKIAPDQLAPHLDALLTMPETPLRRLGVTLLDIDDPRGPAMAEIDPSPTVRIAALERFCDPAPDLIVTALSDGAEVVKAAAVALIKTPLDGAFRSSLVDNMLAWLQVAGPQLGVAVALKLPELAPNTVLAPLQQASQNTALALQVRVAAVRGLGRIVPPAPMAVFADLLASPAQQIRAAALCVINERATENDSDAVTLLADAIAGNLLSAETAVVDRIDPEPDQDVGTPKEGAGPNRITISRDGDIISEQDSPNSAEGKSTLDAILSGATASGAPMAEDTPEESGSKRRKRRAIEGPDAVAISLATDALGIAASLHAPSIVDAIAARLDAPDDNLRRAAWQAISTHRATGPIRQAATDTLQDRDPIVRLAAFQIVHQQPTPALIEAALNDADALIRAAAMAHLPADRVADYVTDPSLTVRKIAAGCIMKAPTEIALRSAMERLAGSDYSDVLSDILGQSAPARKIGQRLLGEADQSVRASLVLLNAFAGIDRRTPKNS